MLRRYDPRMIDDAEKYLKAYDNKDTSTWPDFVPSLVGFARTLNICCSTLHIWKGMDAKEADPENYPRLDEFQEKLEMIMDLQHRTLLNLGSSGDYKAPLAKMILVKHHGYFDAMKKEHDVGGSLAEILAATVKK